MIEGRKLESYVKAAMASEPFVALGVWEIKELIRNVFDDIESEEDLHSQRIQRILKSWVKRGLAYRIVAKGRGGRSGEQSYWILSGEPFEVEE